MINTINEECRYATYNVAQDRLLLNRRIREALDLLQEECGEVIQARSKLRRGGEDPAFRNPTKDETFPDNRTLVAKEIYDVMVLIDYLVDSGFISIAEYREHVPIKLARLKKHSTIFEE